MTKSPYFVVQAHPLILEREDDAPDGTLGCLMLVDAELAQGSCTALFTTGVDLRSDPDLLLRNRILVCVSSGGDCLYSAVVSRNGTMGDMLPEDDELICALWKAAGEADVSDIVKRTGSYRRTRPGEYAAPGLPSDPAIGTADRDGENDGCGASDPAPGE